MTASAILLMNNKRIIRFLYLSAITATLAVLPLFASAQTFSISDNATGGDCLSVGVWNNSTKTCLLTADVNGDFQIESDNITLDGNSHAIIGSEFGSVVSLRWRTGVTVKNLRILSSFVGIDIEDSDRNIISGNVISGGESGIYLFGSSYNIIKDNDISGSAYSGVEIDGSVFAVNSRNIITGNNIHDNPGYGVVLENTDNEQIKDNDISGNLTGVYIEYSYANFVSENIISGNSDTGIYMSEGSAGVEGNSIYGNLGYGLYNDSYYGDIVTAVGNWWGDASGPSQTALNPDGLGDKVSDNVNFIPWLDSDPLRPVEENPDLNNLSQYKFDGETPLTEGGVTAGNSVVFKATLSDPDGDNVAFEVELRESGTEFTGLYDGGIATSTFVASGNEAIIEFSGLTNGIYKWRARAADENGGKSDWREFGSAGNFDLEIKTVPLYTQVRSDYPLRPLANEWADKDYGTGNYSDCLKKDPNTGEPIPGTSTIGRCGCAITSAVMVLRSHGIVDDLNGKDVNPLNMNAWLYAEGGYLEDGGVVWTKIAEYAKNVYGSARVKFDKLVNFKDNATLNSYLAAGNPVILRNKIYGHFLVADDKLNSTYAVRDPRWYETKYLKQNVGNPQFEKNYDNYFDGLRLFSLAPGGIESIYLTLASPAEFLVTDPQGRKLGKDPRTGANYNEIPDGSYGEEMPPISSDTPLDQSRIHKTKVIYIPMPIAGKYDIKVIGTDEGEYTAGILAYDSQGNSHSQTFEGNTKIGLATDYDLNFTPENPEDIATEPADQIAPTTAFSLAGEQGNNGWFISNVQISLSAQDNEGGTGVFKTEYSQDNGGTWIKYAGPFNLAEEGINKLLYRSEDFVGNIEEIKSREIKIDKTPPEAEIYFDKSSQILKVKGVDNLTAEPSVEIFEKEKEVRGRHYGKQSGQTLYTIKDDAGRALKLSLGEVKHHGRQIKAELESLQYDNNPAVEVPKTELKYEWSSDRKTGEIRNLNQWIKVKGKFEINAEYNYRKDETKIEIKTLEGKERRTVPGIAAVKLTTKSGTLGFEF